MALSSELIVSKKHPKWWAILDNLVLIIDHPTDWCENESKCLLVRFL